MQKHDIDERIQKLSDTEIMLNYSQAMTKLYPYMKYVGAYCYDAYNELVEPLFYTMVYHSFSWKYGVNLTKTDTLPYDMWWNSHSNSAHIRVFPKQFPLMGSWNEVPFEISDNFFANNIFVFKAFGDGIHHLSDAEIEHDPYHITFNQTEVTVCHKYNPPQSFADVQFIWILNEQLDYQIYYNHEKLDSSQDSIVGMGK